MNVCQKVLLFAKEGSKFCHILIKPSKAPKTFLNFSKVAKCSSIWSHCGFTWTWNIIECHTSQNILCGMMARFTIIIFNMVASPLLLLLTLLMPTFSSAAFGYELLDPTDLGSFDLGRTIYLNSTYVAYAVAAGAVIILIIAIGLYLYDYYYGSAKSDYVPTDYSSYYSDPHGYNPYAYVGQGGGYSYRR